MGVEGLVHMEGLAELLIPDVPQHSSSVSVSSLSLPVNSCHCLSDHLPSIYCFKHSDNTWPQASMQPSFNLK
jgi:hypothetical protein